MAAALVEQTYDALMQMIMDGNYKPGDRLPSEMILCNNLQVSRNTLRAALNKLNVLGFTGLGKAAVPTCGRWTVRYT